MLQHLFQNESVIAACKQFKVIKLHAFGSVVSGELTESSDLDFVVEFEREGFTGAFDQFMGFKETLEKSLGRPVDLLVNKRFRNYVFQEEIDKTKRLVYAA